MPNSHTPTVRVDFTGHDRWEVKRSDSSADRATFASIIEARCAAHDAAEADQPSELVICNAYHDVIEFSTFPAHESQSGDGRGADPQARESTQA